MIQSFPPLLGPTPRILILGSMPGQASLAAGEYYAHPRNAFWPIMHSICGAAPTHPYPQRVAHLTQAGIAVWDVLAACQRHGSLDSAIDLDTAEPNAVDILLANHPSIHHLFFNGTLAATTFHRHFGQRFKQLRQERLPSTSPAHAGMSSDAKAARWHSAITAALLPP